MQQFENFPVLQQRWQQQEAYFVEYQDQQRTRVSQLKM